jgi:DNA-binding beta-propeller fold protein YncE
MRDYRRLWLPLFLVIGWALGPAASAARPPQDQAQAGLIAEIGEQLNACRNLIRDGQKFQEALDLLSPLTARVFTVTDRSRQMGLAVEIFLLKGIAQSGLGNDAAAVLEFRSMLGIDPSLAREATKNIYDSKLNGLLRRAEGRASQPVPAPAPEKAAPPAAADRETAPPPGLTLRVASVPTGARIFLDGADTGKVTDAQLPGVPRGQHAVRLTKEFYADWEGPVPAPSSSGRAVIEAKLYAASYSSADIWGGERSGMFAGPAALAAAPGNLIYIADPGPVRVRITNSEGESQAFGGGPEMDAVARPGGLAVDAQGNVYLSDPESHAILKFDRTGRFLKTWGKFGAGSTGLNTPLGLAVDGRGNILLADGGNGLIKRFTPEGGLVGSFGQEGPDSSRLVFPRGVAVNSRGEIVVLDRAQAVLFAPDGRRIAAWGKDGAAEGEFAEPQGIGVDAFDCVYVADSGNHRLQKFDPRGRFLCAWGGPGTGPMLMSDPSAVAVDSKGAVYVAERNNRRVQIFIVGSGALGAPESEPVLSAPGRGGAR